MLHRSVHYNPTKLNSHAANLDRLRGVKAVDDREALVRFHRSLAPRRARRSPTHRSTCHQSSS
jgi:hypothetical protein